MSFKKIATLFIPFILLFSLSLWQLFRFNWKSNIISNINSPPIYVHSHDNLIKFNYRKVELEGVLSGIDLKVFAGQHGYYSLSPMLIASGNYMLINRGIAQEKTKIEKVTINGILHCNNAKNWFIKSDSTTNMWFTFNTQEISDELGIKLEKCVLWCDNFNIIKPTKHLEYSATWLSLAIIWLIGCIFYYRKHNSK